MRRRNLHQLPSGHNGVFGVRTSRHGVGDAIAHGDAGDVGRDRFHGSRAFASENHGQRRRIQAHPKIDIDVVDAGRRDLDQRLAGTRRRLRDVAKFQFLDTAELLDKDSFHSVLSFLRR